MHSHKDLHLHVPLFLVWLLAVQNVMDRVQPSTVRLAQWHSCLLTLQVVTLREGQEKGRD